MPAKLSIELTILPCLRCSLIGTFLTVLRFLFSWYRDQELVVRWNADISASFNVSNGVRQGGVLSPILFTVYIDELLQRLSRLGIGCQLGGHSVCALGYADDIWPPHHLPCVSY